MHSSEALDSASDVEESKLSLNISEEEASLLQSLREWLAEVPHINARKDDLSLLYFIRGCKHDLDRAKSKLERFYQMKTERQEFYSNRDPLAPKIQELLEVGVCLPLHVKDEFNRRIFVIRTSAHNPKVHDMDDVYKAGKMITDLAFELYPEISTDGFVAIFDMKGVTLQHALQLSPPVIQKTVDIWHIYPCKPKLLEFVNPPAHVNFVLNIFKLFMSPKMKSRLFVRRGNSTVNAALPRELGGNEGTYKELAQYWKKKAEQNVEFFKYNEQFKAEL